MRVRVKGGKEYAERRKEEYPPIEEQLDALWKGGADAEAMKKTIMAIKKKHPKGIVPGRPDQVPQGPFTPTPPVPDKKVPPGKAKGNPRK